MGDVAYQTRFSHGWYDAAHAGLPAVYGWRVEPAQRHENFDAILCHRTH